MLFQSLTRAVSLLLLVQLAACGSDAGTSGVAAEDDDGADPRGAESTADAGGAAPSGTSDGPIPGPTSTSVEPGPERPQDDFVVEEDEVLVEEGEPVACEREIEFEAVVLSDPEPFDVIIVADHSQSLGWSKDDLSSGLSQLLANIGGRNARFFVLTPTQYGASSSASNRFGRDDLVPWRDPVTGTPYENEVTRYTETCTDGAEQIIDCPEDPSALEQDITIEGRFEFVMPEPVASITQDMTDEQIQAQQEAIKEAILKLEGSGSSYEQPLCTLGRYVSQAPELLPRRAVFVVLSDEDDQTDPSECLAGVRYTRYRKPAQVSDCSGGCDYAQYWAFAPASRYWISYRCVPTDDLGTPFPDQAKEGAFTYTTVDGGCKAPMGECTERDLDSVQRYCSPGSIIEDCSSTCGNDADDRVACSIDLEDSSIDACVEPFEFGGATYENMAEYCQHRYDTEGWGDCDRRLYSSSVGTGSWAGGLSPLRLVPGALETSHLADYFLRQADTAFGADNYFVELIALQPQFECVPQSGQSYATSLLSIASSDADVFPICESYAPALDRISGFAQESLQVQYTFSLSERETLEAIVVTDLSGQERRLSPSQYQYDFFSSQLTLDRAAITARDRKLTVEVAIHCMRVVR